MNITRYIMAAATLLCAAHTTPAAAQNAAAAAPASAGADIRWTADTLHVRFILTCPRHTAGSRYAVWAMPRIGAASGDTLTLAPAVFRGKDNMRYVGRERHFASTRNDRMARRLQSSPRSTMQRARGEVLMGDTVRYDVAIARSQRPWMWQNPITLDVRREKDGCCTTEPMDAQQLAATRYVPPFVPRFAPVQDNTGRAGALEKDNPVLQHISQYRPYSKDRILRKERGALYVHFGLDKAELMHDFRDNAATLDRIVDITRQIMADSTSSVKKIQIIGLASVEGSIAHNERLAGQRAQALKRYIQQRVNTPDALYDVANGGEAWTELRSQIEDLQFEGRDELLRIIDTERDADVRERRMKTLMSGRPYAYLRDRVLADQRNSGYLRIYYDYVPDSAAATINRATKLIGREQYAEALSLLRTVSSDPRAQNALGVALYMTGQHEQGMERIRRAAEAGNSEAKDNLRQWKAIKKAGE